MVWPQNIAVLGAGSWGTALAIQLSRNGHEILLWGRSVEAQNAMAETHQNSRYLPGLDLPTNIQPVSDLDQALQACEVIVVAVPSEGFREVLRDVARVGTRGPLVWATKGLESKSAKLLHQVVVEELGPKLDKAVLSGPSFAREVAQGLPTAVTVAADNLRLAGDIASLFHGDRFRVYTSEDIVGVELGGALKNVLAIATGISDGLGFGANARAALITRGLSEIMRLGACFEAHRDTLSGLSGLGDLVLTCTDDQSRNRRLGLAIGQGIPREMAIRNIGQSVEGAETARVAEHLACDKEVEMPIAEAVCRILYRDLNPHTAVTELLDRDLKVETL